ncbi:MAG: hypothetical protein DRN14_05835 [Thermoplasmata archaeon]|nr:MAG: hypothetical protein DRN14_05835 [Thermoplasmata archaeon]
MFALITFIPYDLYLVTFLVIISSILLILMDVKYLDRKWKFAGISLSILSLIFIIIWISYPHALSHFLWNLFVFTSLFLTFYYFSYYEIKKFPAFAYSFSLIYIMTESISLWRGDTESIFFIIYLTIILPMYMVGIKKIRD